MADHQVAYLIALAVLTLASGIVTALLGWLAKSVNARMKSGAAKDAALEIIEVARVVVKNIEQTLKPRLLKESGGKLTPTDIETLQDTAFLDMKDQVSDQAQRVLKANGTRVDHAMMRAVESAVIEVKQSKALEALARNSVPPSASIADVVVCDNR